MNKPEPMTPEQIDAIDATHETLQDTYKAIEAARDAQWEEMLSKQEALFVVEKDYNRPLRSQQLNEGDKLYAAPVDQAAEIEWLKEQNYKLATAVGDQNRKFIAEQAEIERLRGALDKLARLGNGDKYGNSIGNEIARAALGEQK